MKNLNIYYSMTFVKLNDNYYCNGAFGRYVDELAKHFDNITLCIPVKHADTSQSINLDYCIKSKNIYYQEMPYYRNMIGSVKYLFLSYAKLIRYSRDWENMYLRCPSPYVGFVCFLAKLKKINLTFHLVGDTSAVIKQGDKYTGIWKLLALSYSFLGDITLKKELKNANVIANGSGLRRFYNNQSAKVSEIRTSTFSNTEITYRYNSCKNKVIKLLYVGYIRHEKGLQYLIKAIHHIINSSNMKIKLTIVGEGDEVNNLKQLIKSLNLEDNIEFKGYISLGESLFNIYRESDIFVLPSLSEGTPRVLIEAMANGLPVVATNVGGIPYTIEHRINGLLIEAKNVQSISDAIQELVNDSNLRMKLIKYGYEFAEQNTLERHATEVLSIIDGGRVNE